MMTVNEMDMELEHCYGVGLTEVLDYLDRLRESGITNMFDAGQYVQETFDVDRNFANELLGHWMNTFDERQSEHKE